ncbi:tetratricopeptide (TPR) repeat protein [Parabacteroides sp. PF5-5]|uniref:RagB/SusD family nutrient uptake outer membrane protein n=1 Tax=unclassified Parabacteroides TaxID=2649774 RepID=UPI002474B278|nr:MULTISPECIES: RagB/SusD family nutrient uptake outer membrane protein [unclassified Parabacteroides]MDH6303423.1 tetratricopeptide (TPR) repeat protein [Parabacteroides sp. PH5-39]MDH6314746.1 tetratricopeptide (TPR) repeat protein [Parabacteroides sp. PF5-13]MDH6318083.1 tetratricopeptide (TPR) repeat protein [Parabacteroides sp. PH5-13]MDH6321986.1 tetratricopeptide (TPR) repeat protein [Parabacteroides sp. PH5-8]MDH6326109.1 tetratricopeptide (TPR) repeat protein [Parabacteroides sp. PH5
MKKISIYILSGLLLLTANSCSDYLEVDHYDILPGDMMFESEENANSGLIGCYDTFYPTKKNAPTDLAMWGFKPQFMLANHPTMDTQASGWDKTYCTQDWTASSAEFEQVWIGHYTAISRCNVFLAGLEDMENHLFEAGEQSKKELEAQARAIRAWNYLNLAKNFGRIPMLQTGETYSNTPSKPRPETEDGTWDLIVEDLVYAANILGWKPINNEYGRITKGFCLAYQAIAKMYQGKYDEAKGLFKQIVDSGTYSLLPCYSYLFDPENAWTPEDVFAVVMWSDWGNNMGGTNGWDPKEDHYMWVNYNCASMEYNGWGSLFISWECYYSFEEGDRRRAASMVALGETNPWTDQTIGANGAPTVKTGSEFMPNISSVKYWRKACDYWTTINQPFSIRTLRYAEVLLDYAECCFRTGDDATGWEMIKQIRERAFGNLEVTLNDPEYPIPMLTETVTVPDAKTYYAKYKADKGYAAEPWLIAVNMERRHEFNAEYSFFYDLKRSGLLDEFIEKEYPKNVGVNPSADPDKALNDWHIYRAFEHNPNKMLFPIPEKEILTNDAIGREDQNPGY